MAILNMSYQSDCKSILLFNELIFLSHPQLLDLMDNNVRIKDFFGSSKKTRNFPNDKLEK